MRAESYRIAYFLHSGGDTEEAPYVYMELYGEKGTKIAICIFSDKNASKPNTGFVSEQRPSVLFFPMASFDTIYQIMQHDTPVFIRVRPDGTGSISTDAEMMGDLDDLADLLTPR